MSLSDSELAAHDPLAGAFLKHLRARLPAGAFEERAPERSKHPYVMIARIPAASPAVGDVLIYSDGDELTTFVGDHTHGHTGAYLFGGPNNPAAIDRAAASVAAWVRDLLADGVIVWSQRTAERQVLSGGTVSVEDIAGVLGESLRRRATEAWYWSGRPFRLAEG